MSARILTVDDSASIRMTIKIALSEAGYAVEEADNGAAGIQKANGGGFDMIITDLNMPVMDGLTMIEEMRRLPDLAGVPIIFLTTESDEAMKQRAKAAGATGWLTKPFNSEQLVRVARKVLGQ
jgi:two-component system, chemotaxis family, chemotaxis protein CheY